MGQELELSPVCWQCHQPCPPSLGAGTKPQLQPAPLWGLSGGLFPSPHCARGDGVSSACFTFLCNGKCQISGGITSQSCGREGWRFLGRNNSTSGVRRNSSFPLQVQRCSLWDRTCLLGILVLFESLIMQRCAKGAGPIMLGGKGKISRSFCVSEQDTEGRAQGSQWISQTHSKPHHQQHLQRHKTRNAEGKKSNSNASHKWYLSLEVCDLSSPLLLIPPEHQIKLFPFTESPFPGAECVSR